LRKGRLSVEKVTRILAIVERRENGALVLEKAVALARRFGARVDLMLPDGSFVADLATLCHVMKYDEVVLSSVHRGQAPMGELILRHALETRPDLVVKEPAGAHPMHRWTLDENDWQLANECPAPVLLVRHRRWASPVRFAAAVDVSDRDTSALARSILHTAGFLAMGIHGNLDILYSEREQHDEAIRMERAVILAQLVREFHVGCERIQVISGEPGKALPPLLAARQYDVLVIGAHSRQTGLRAFIGGTISRLIDATEGDVVLVKAPARGIVENGNGKTSAREQRSDQLEQFV
jgi:nucleotide-binding universal stress UspA family protein